MFDGEVRSLVVILTLVPVLIHKMTIEEQLMTEQFGSEYTNYRRTTKAFVPYLW